MNPYGYQKTVFQVNLSTDIRNKYYLRYAADFPTAHPTAYPEYNTVRGLYYQPIRKNPSPLVVMVHGMGDFTTVPLKTLAPSLAKRGIACFILYLPFHSTRMPATIRERIPNLTPQEQFEGFQLSVIDIFQVLDWLAERPEIDIERNAVMGASYGGFVSAVAMGIDSRIKAGIFIVTGGNNGKINRLCKSKAYCNEQVLSEEEYWKEQTDYREYLEAVKSHGFENVNPPDQTFQMDPLTFVDKFKNRPLLMLNATGDKYIPREAVLDFWEACGKPQLRWFPGGHIGIWCYYPVIAHLSTDFLKSNFQER